MNERVRFGKEDIGGELLPILTSGLYRDVFDTLREYIQNAIDADSQHIELVIDPDVVSVSDDGVGMTAEEARDAIKLGISEKNPLEDVGFRGIGIYSAFNLCNRLEIYTRAQGEDQGYVLCFDFRRMREALLAEAERRKQRLPPSLYLEKLLQESVSVEGDTSGVVAGHGTRAVLSGLIGEVYKRLNDWGEVVSYLQNVVPLPFHPNFRYDSEIESKFRTEDYRTVPLTLQIGPRREPVYRPYHDGMFEHGGEHPPQFFDIKDTRHRFGFAWVCINDARKVLRDEQLRGLLIKKFGFSIATRSYLEPYFGRTVFNRRITGEVIIQHPELLPNAARSDFEHNAVRQTFLQALPRFVREVSAWANKIQQKEKAREVLAEVSDRVAGVEGELVAGQRDRELLLRMNVELAQLEHALRSHAKTLREIEADHFAKTEALLKDCQRTVHQALVEKRQTSRKLEQRVRRSVQREAQLPTEAEKRHLEDVPRTLVDLLDSYDLVGNPELRRVLRFLDENVLQAHLDPETYRQSLVQLREYLEESP